MTARFLPWPAQLIPLLVGLLFGLVTAMPAQAKPELDRLDGHLCVHDNLQLAAHQLAPWVVGTDQPRVAEALRREHGLAARIYEDQTTLHQAAAGGEVLLWWCQEPVPASLSLLYPRRVELSLTDPVRDEQQYADDSLLAPDEQKIDLRTSEEGILTDYAPLVVGVPADSSPIISYTADGQLQGMDVDVLRLIAERLDMELKWRDCGNWRSCIEALANRDIDLLSFFTPTAERQQFADFTIPYWEVPWALVSPDYRPVQVDTYEDLSDTTVAVVSGYSVIDEMRDADVPLKIVDSPSDGLQAVLSGDADAYLDSLPMLVERAREQLAGNLRITVLRDEPGDSISLGVRNDYAGLVEVLDRAILAITSGEREQIEQRWFQAQLDTDTISPEVIFWLQVASVVVLLVAGVVVSRIMFLRRKLDQHQHQVRQYRHQAEHDTLTGLPNRDQLMARLTEAIMLESKQGKSLALLFIDLDGFKKVNDEQGHRAGDTMLQLVAKRLLNTVRETDTVARFGGDEFVILLTGLNESAEAITVGHKVIDRLSRPFRIDDKLARVGASIGVATYPEHGHNAEELVKAADKAMYRVKNSGKNDVFLPTAADSDSGSTVTTDRDDT